MMDQLQGAMFERFSEKKKKKKKTYDGGLPLPSLQVLKWRKPLVGLRPWFSLHCTQPVVLLEHRSTRDMEPYNISNKFGGCTFDILYDEGIRGQVGQYGLGV